MNQTVGIKAWKERECPHCNRKIKVGEEIVLLADYENKDYAPWMCSKCYFEIHPNKPEPVYWGPEYADPMEPGIDADPGL